MIEKSDIIYFGNIYLSCIIIIIGILLFNQTYILIGFIFGLAYTMFYLSPLEDMTKNYITSRLKGIAQ